MNSNAETEKEYRTFEEYRESFYPDADKESKLNAEDPYSLGVILARESLSKFRDLLTEKDAVQID